MSNAPAFIPFTRPSFDQETIDAVADVLRSGWVTSGPKLAEFEATLSNYFGGRPVRCFANGTATMKIALQVAGIGAGDEVLRLHVAQRLLDARTDHRMGFGRIRAHHHDAQIDAAMGAVVQHLTDKLGARLRG